MRHARPEDLDRIEPLLTQLRAVETLTERKRGVFYRRSKAFLHFHEHEGEILADVRGPQDWERFSAARAKWSALLKRARQLAL